HALVPDGRGLDGLAVQHRGHEGDHPALGEVDLLDPLTGLVEAIVKPELDGLQPRGHGLALLRRERVEETISKHRIERFPHEKPPSGSTETRRGQGREERLSGTSIRAESTRSRLLPSTLGLFDRGVNQRLDRFLPVGFDPGRAAQGPPNAEFTEASSIWTTWGLDTTYITAMWVTPMPVVLNE